MMLTAGCDTSRYQAPIDAATGWGRGLRFAALRATIGDYYTDPTLRTHWQQYKDAGYLVTAYCVVAPADGNGRRITSTAHLDCFTNAISGLEPDFPWVMDSELTRNQSRDYITQVTREVAVGLGALLYAQPIVYTRQSWWDTWIKADPLWHQCDLWAARYASGLTGPWSDGRYRFRDWQDWKFWQHTDKANGPYYGVTSLELDLDWYNGSEAELYAYAQQEPPITPEDKLDILWREAARAGWNLEK